MTMLFRISLRDMKSGSRSSMVAILALTIGLWGVGSLLVSTVILSNDLSENFSRTVPAQLIIESKQFDRLNIEDLRARANIEAAEFRDMSVLRIEGSPDEWISLFLFSVEDFHQMATAKLFKQKGQFPPPPGSVMVERNSLLAGDFTLGSSVRIQSNGHILKTIIAGIVFDPGQAPSTQDAVIYAYTDPQTYTELSGHQAGQRLIIRFTTVVNKQDVQREYRDLLKYLDTRGIVIKNYDIPNVDEHPHQFQLNTLLLLNALIGFLSFAMAMVLISQLMNSILSQQIRQIGIMKGIGATRWHVLKLYGSRIIIMSAASVLIGVPAAIATGKAFSGFVSEIINFDVLTTQIPLSINTAIIALGFVLPMIFSLPALLRGTRISVADALRDYGINVDTAQSSNTTTTKYFGLLSLTIRNIGRRKGRMIVTMATMILGVALFLTGFNTRESLSRFLDNTYNAMKYDIVIDFARAQSLETAVASFSNIKFVKLIEGWTDTSATIDDGNGSTADAINVTVLPFDSQLKGYQLQEGSWLSGSPELEFVANQAAAVKFRSLNIGQYYSFVVHDKLMSAKLVGLVQEIKGATIYVDTSSFYGSGNDKASINRLMFSLDDRSYENVSVVKKVIEQRVANEHLVVTKIYSQAQLAKAIFEHLNIILTTILLLSLLVLLVSAVGMGSAMGINVMERTREIGVLRAIGATPNWTVNLFLIEGFIISACSVVLGVLLALPLSKMAAVFFGQLILGKSTQLDFAFSVGGFAITMVVTLIFGYIACYFPAKAATRITVRDALIYV